MTEKDELREHSFDGIQEYDNDLPRWWLWLFAITIVIAVVYPFVYDFGPASFDSETIDAEMAALRTTQQTAQQSAGPSSDADLLKLAKNSDARAEGQQVYASRCIACHGDKGQGVVGPNLTDEYWIHGG